MGQKGIPVVVFSVSADSVTGVSYKSEHSPAAPFLDNSAPKQQENNNFFQEKAKPTSDINRIVQISVDKS